MTDYNTLTKVELKKILLERNLPDDGLKADLINRLISNDEETKRQAETSSEILATETNVEETDTSAVASANVETTDAPSSTTDAVLNATNDTTERTENTADRETTGNEVKKDEPKQLPSPEEMKKLALDHLNKKLHRANKFGAEQSVVDEIHKSINRVEKFGLDLQNPLAVELGLVKPQSKPKNRQPHSNRRKNRSRSNNNGMSYGGNGRNSRYRVRKGGYVSNNNNNRRGGSGRRY